MVRFAHPIIDYPIRIGNLKRPLNYRPELQKRNGLHPRIALAFFDSETPYPKFEDSQSSKAVRALPGVFALQSSLHPCHPQSRYGKLGKMSQPHNKVPADINRRLLSLSLPLAGTQLANIALSTTDTIVMGQLGTQALAGGGLAVIWFNQLRTMGVGILTPLGNRIAHHHARWEESKVGSKERDQVAAEIKDLSRVGLLLSTLLGVVGGFLLVGIGLALPLIGQPSGIVDYALPTMIALAPGLIPCLWFQVARQFTVGLSKPQALLLITLVSILINLVLDLALAHGYGPIPALGVWGIGLATSLVHLCTASIFLTLIKRNSSFNEFYDHHLWKASPSSIRRQLKLGVPVSLTYGAEAGMFSVLAMIMGTLSAEALAAHNVAYQVTFIVFQFGVGFSHGASIVVSSMFSTRSPQAARSAAVRAMVMVLIIVALAALAFWTIPRTVLGPFLHAADEQTITLAVSLLTIGALMEVVDTGQNVAIGVLRGIGDTTTGLKASLVGYWIIGLPVALLFSYPLALGPQGVWWGLTLGLAAASAVLWKKFFHSTASTEGS
ncbi:Multidrug resistance protein NorM [Corynebacterium diphtheriae subsp. lausannense]|nr:Multidrug resistance protein NorM [Corynebacterium diphtheriae subsp. lausannense]